jgi:hypothetical protein
MALHITRIPKKGGHVPTSFPKVGFNYMVGFFNVFRPDFNGFFPCLEDLETILRPYIGDNL